MILYLVRDNTIFVRGPYLCILVNFHIDELGCFIMFEAQCTRCVDVVYPIVYGIPTSSRTISVLFNE